ncbi:hypothetical protein [Methylocaldum sp. 14B]|uniref:hypothetical protein n=1 Tax=Methylocaldum sp. 14B TaxID=1912213 RepID=UPI00117DB5E8|nr:hypothetical protein [Methylocaldum sp. 14B]
MTTYNPRLLESRCEHDDVEGDIGLDGARAGLTGKRRALVRRVRRACLERRTRACPAGRLRPAAARTDHQDEY